MMQPNSTPALSIHGVANHEIVASGHIMTMIKNPRTITFKLMAGPILGARCDVNSIPNQIDIF